MLTPSVDSQEFYQSQRGRVTQAILRAHVDRLWPDISGTRILPLGSGALLLGSLPFVSGRMTATQGETFSCFVDSKNKPLPDADLDRIVALHAMATSSDMELGLREAWRTLKGEGRLLIVVPRRCGAWAKKPDTPFGREEAYSGRQIKKALTDQGFIVTRIRRALFAPPDGAEAFLSLAYKIETIAPFLFFGGGVLFVEGRKRVCGFAGAKKRAREHSRNPLLPLPLPI